MKLNFDYHNHTALSYCSKKNYTAREMVLRMKEVGLVRAGFSDHYYPNETVPANSVRIVREEIGEVSDIDIAIGTEVDMVAPGVLEAGAEELAPFDFVSVACPHWHNDRIKRPIRYTNDCLAQEQYDMVLSLSRMPYVDILVHPFTFSSAEKFMPIDQRALMGYYTEADLDRIIDGFLKSDIALELHANLLKEDYAESLKPLIRRCVSRGVKFSLGSDAHEIARVGCIRNAAELIDSFGIPDELAYVPKKKRLG